jgi:Regulator of Vps4 activity in the MVB pathway
MAVSRIQIASNKKSALLKQNMREIAVMLSEEPPKEEKAKIRAEAIIRDDNMIEALEILQLECELLHERIKLLQYSKECPSDLVGVVSTVMWASHRVDIPELLMVRKQFRAKYGKQFDDNAINNVGGVLNERVVAKLSIHPPAAYLVQTYLEKICLQHEVDWTPKVKLSTNEMIEPVAAPIGYSVQVAAGTGLGSSIGNPLYPHPSMLGAAVVTGQEEGVQPDDGDFDIPVAPSSKINSHSNNSKGRGGGGSGDDGPGGISSLPPPVVTAHPYVPPPSEKKDDDFDEVDIFVPGASGAGKGAGGGGPSAPPGSTGVPSPSASTLTTNTTTQQEHHPANGTGGGGGGGGGGSTNPSYEDLAARFNQLKK